MQRVYARGVGRRLLGCAVCLLLLAGTSVGQEQFSQTVGQLSVKPVKNQQPIEVPFITWGGDAATFHANGGLDTKSGTIYDGMGLKMKLTNGDDFPSQVKKYMSGQTPFLRGTFRMLGQASEVIASDTRTKPVVIMQLSWSAGDHIVSRGEFKSLNDLASKGGKKVKIACQKGGPHVGLLYDSLAVVKIPRDQIEIDWVSDLTGPKGPADAFRNDPSIGACCVITPDMFGLTGGPDSKGTGAEGTVKDAKVLNSTASMSRSIADVYAVRSDWYKANKDWVQKFVAGYLKATNEVVQLRNDYDKSGKMKPAYRKLLSMSQDIFGEEVLPTLEEDAHGLLLDCNFVGLPGQLSFFEDAGNFNGFEKKMAAALDMAKTWGYAKTERGFAPPTWDYDSIGKSIGVKVDPKHASGSGAGSGKFEGAELEDFGNEGLDENTIVSFTINFKVNDTEFKATQFSAEFEQALKAASTFGNAVVVIRGHADPTKALSEFVRAGLQKKTIRVVGTKDNRRYFLKNGAQLDLTKTEIIEKLIATKAFESRDHKPTQIVAAALRLSKSRADAVKKSLVSFAEKEKVTFDASQIQPVGAGISDPVIPRPINNAQAAENRRVEFRIVRVPAEALAPSDFDF